MTKIEIQRRINGLKRKLVHFLLGEPLLIEKRERGNLCTYELVNTKSRINFGKYKVIAVKERCYKDIVVTSFEIRKL